jgi:hypothetical protein
MKLVLVVVAVTILAGAAFGAAVVYPVSYNGDLDSVKFVLLRDGALNDSALITSFPNDTTLSLDDTYNWTLQSRYYYTGESSYLASSTWIRLVLGFDHASIASTLSSNHGSGTWSGRGGGTSNILLYYAVVDSDSIMGVTISVTATDGSSVGRIITDANGSALFSPVTGVNYVVSGHKPGHLFDVDTITYSGHDTLVLSGVNTFLQPVPPIGAQLSAVYGYVYDLQRQPVQYATLTFSFAGSVSDTCSDVSIMAESFETETDATGYFRIDLMNTTCTGQTNPLYKVVVRIDDDKGDRLLTDEEGHAFALPSDSLTYRLVLRE